LQRIGLGLSVTCSDENVWDTTRAALAAANTSLLERFLASLLLQLQDCLRTRLTAPLTNDSVAAALANMSVRS
jgi:hypothetical protein